MRRLAVILSTVFAVSCNPARNIAVVDVGEVTLNGLKSVHTTARVRNDAAKDLTVEDATLRFDYKGRELAEARLMRPVTVRARTTDSVTVNMGIESGSLWNLLALQRRMTLNPAEVMVSVKAEVRYGKFRRTVEMENIPYSVIIANFEAR